ncbi:MAG: hypothetical protein WBP79_11965 [Candidatus Acidiferrales bacterium]
MSFHEPIRKAAFLGMKHEAEDIFDYIMIQASLLVSVLMGAVLGIWVGRAAGLWAGVPVGIGSYAVSIRICTLMLFRGRRQR